MDKMKAKRAALEIGEVMEDVSKEDWRDPKATEHLKNLAKLHCFYEAEAKEVYIEPSMRMGPAMPLDDGRGGMGLDYSERRGANGRYMSGADRESYGYSYGSTKEQLRQWMQDPSLNYEAKEYLRKAMETMR